MFSKLLVANRGEIAVRVMRTCERMGIATVAVFSDADWDAPHVRRAGEAVMLGAAPPAASYLALDKIIAAARSAGAEAIHPGYGFLSENPAFPEACAQAGLAFVGPSAAAMRLLGDKLAARRLAEQHAVPVLPGVEIAAGDDAASAGLEAVGFPLMVKAAAGGGGRGMRLVSSREELPDALAAARREALAAFADGRLFVERAVTAGRHIEVQVLADAHGNVLQLGERDCSTQRRHQKVIEESPAPGVDAALRGRLGDAALTVARAAAYTNAGTVEFLVDRDASFYFLEVNARLQVEHPVTEMVTGLDLVELQIRVAAGERLPIKQDDVRIDGHAIECRLVAEDPLRGHLPASGRVTYFLPPALDGVRVDAGIVSGSAAPAEYDSLLAKIIAHAPTRAEAIDRCSRALAATAVEGLTTNLGLLEAVLREPAFQAGKGDLELLASMPVDRFAPRLPADALVAAAAADVAARPATGSGDPWDTLGAWRAHGPVRLAYLYHGRPFVVDAAPLDGRSSWRMAIGDENVDVEAAWSGEEIVVRHRGGKERRWRVQGDATHVVVDGGGGRYALARSLPSPHAAGAAAGAVHAGEARAPMPGVVVRVLVVEGERVAARQPLAVLEAMKMEHIIESPIDGVVRRVLVAEGDRVSEGDVLIEVEPEAGGDG